MSRHDLFDRILRMTQKAAIGDVQWTVPASMINGLIRTNGNNLAIYQGRSPAAVDIYLARSCYGGRRRSDVVERYFTHFFRRDEAIPRVVRLPEGQLTPTGQLYTEQRRRPPRIHRVAQDQERPLRAPGRTGRIANPVALRRLDRTWRGLELEARPG